MSRKLFLSFLGATNYTRCNYYKEEKPDQKIENVKYVQEALVQLYCTDFQPGDQFCFFLTKKAREKNWENSTQNEQGLKARLLQLSIREEQILEVDIPEGSSTEKIWDIFERVFGVIGKDDEVHLDITHSFRFFPMLGMALLNYAKALHGISVKGIYYGAFEAAPNNNSNDLRNAPIFDLISISDLQDWTNAAYEFVHYGKVSNLRQLTKKQIKPVLAETKGADEIARRLSIISNTTEEMAKAIATNRGAKIYQSIDFDNLNDNLQFFEEHQSFIKPLNAIIKTLADKVAPFKNNDPLHWLKSARWCVNHGMYQQAITQLREGVLTWLCLQLQPVNGFFDWKNKIPRDLLSSIFTIINRSFEKDKWEKEARKYAWLTHTLIQHPFFKEMAPLFSSLRHLRNDVNHGGYTGQQKQKNKNESDKKVSQCKKIVEQFEAIDWSAPLEVKFSPLLNLSNHPLSSWQEAQKAEAERLFGRVEDMPFPAVPPEADEEAIDALVDEYFEAIVKQSPAAVHIMGEMTFTCRLVEKLKAHGITCLASTTERIAREEGGHKITEFRFSRFRKY